MIRAMCVMPFPEACSARIRSKTEAWSGVAKSIFWKELFRTIVDPMLGFIFCPDL
jgi:hypothetical protein